MSAVSIESVTARPRPRGVEVSSGPVVRAGRRRSCVGVVASAAVERRRSWIDRVQTAIFVVLTVLGFLIATPALIEMTRPDPAVDPIPGDPAWAHVTDR